MGLSATTQIAIYESVRNGEGGSEQMSRAQKLINEMRTSIPDFSQHASVYTQLAKYLANDKTCTPQDVVNTYNSIKEALKNNGKPTEDKDVMQVLNQFRSMVRDSDINFLYQKADMNKDQITDFLKNIAVNAFGTGTWKDGVITYLNNVIQNNANNSDNNLTSQKTDLITRQNDLYRDFLNNNNSYQLAYIKKGIEQSSDVFK